MPQAPQVARAAHGHFERVLNNKDVLALAFGAMIGWGWAALARR